MITKEKIAQGLKDRAVRLEIDPQARSALFHVGPNWFYFGESTDAMNLDEYLENVPMEDIVDGIYDILESCLTHDRMKDVYQLCDALLISSTKTSAPTASNSREFFVDTPLGKLKVWAKHKTDDPEDFPGVYVDLVGKDGEEDVCLACVEYESSKEGLYTCVYGNVKDDSPTHVIRHNAEDL